MISEETVLQWTDSGVMVSLNVIREDSIAETLPPPVGTEKKTHTCIQAA